MRLCRLLVGGDRGLLLVGQPVRVGHAVAALGRALQVDLLARHYRAGLEEGDGAGGQGGVGPFVAGDAEGEQAGGQVAAGRALAGDDVVRGAALQGDLDREWGGRVLAPAGFREGILGQLQILALDQAARREALPGLVEDLDLQPHRLAGGALLRQRPLIAALQGGGPGAGAEQGCCGQDGQAEVKQAAGDDGPCV